MPKTPTLKISLSGVRGIVGDSLTPQLATSFAAAFGTLCGPGAVLVGTDTRPSRQMVAQAVFAGLLSVGCAPVDLGVVPVPVLQFHTRRVKAAGAICITASHNPLEWNALKFYGSDGIALGESQFSELKDLYHQGIYPRVSSKDIAETTRDLETPVAAHREAVLAAVDRKAISARGFRVAVDCCNGAGSLAAPAFLRSLGCQVFELHTDPERPFPRNPEPVRAHLGDLSKKVRESGADVGFAQDADADRLALVDETGEPLGEDVTVAMAVRHVLSRTPGPVVVNLSTSRMIDDIAESAGCPVYRSKVGEIHVLQEIFRRQAVVGGEGNGGVILPSLNPCRDSFAAMALLLEALSREETTLSQMRERLPYYAIVKEKVPCRRRDIVAFLRLLRHLYRDCALDLTDGVKIVWSDRWLHVRGSNTEPIVRLVAEAPQREQAVALINQAAEYLRPIAGQQG